MNIPTQDFLEDISDSINLHSENSEDSPVYILNIHGIKQTNPPSSSSNSIPFQSQETVNNTNKNKYKCFRCFGRNRKIQNLLDKQCQQCFGKSFITSEHPIVGLMEKLLAKRLPNSIYKQNRKMNLNVDQIYNEAIKEQSFSCQEEFQFCSNCKKQSDNMNFKICQICPDYNVCEKCYTMINFSHPHPLGVKRLSKLLSSCNYSFYSKQSNNKNISHNESFQQLAQIKNPLTDKFCDNCSKIIDGYFEFCTLCENQGESFIICDDCSIQNNYQHKHKNNMQAKMTQENNNLLIRINSKSQADHARDLLLQKNISNQLKYSKIFSNINDLDINLTNNHRIEQSGQIFHQMQTESFNLNQNTDELPDITIHLKNKLSNTYHNLGQYYQKNKGRKDNLLTYSLDLENSNISSQNLIKSKNTEPLIKQEQSSIRMSESDYCPQQQYLFKTYCCDLCGAEPLKNYRYNCRNCDDFDLCQDCYLERRQQHNHKQFQQIDGRKLMKIRQEQQIKKSIKFQTIKKLGFNSGGQKASMKNIKGL